MPVDGLEGNDLGVRRDPLIVKSIRPRERCAGDDAGHLRAVAVFIVRDVVAFHPVPAVHVVDLAAVVVVGAAGFIVWPCATSTCQCFCSPACFSVLARPLSLWRRVSSLFSISKTSPAG